MLDGHFNEWLNLLVRWLHIITGIAWIGASFYFNWLENNLVRSGQQKPGIAGYLWAIHGGGIYRLEKYQSAPATMPETLHWFKWEAYTTWLTGMALLFVQYYLNANLYLIDPQVMALEPWQAVAIGLGVIVASWVVYDVLSSQLAHKPLLLSIIGLGLLALAAYGLTHVFSGRGAFIHVGAMIGTAMVGNVAHVIMPSQRALLAAVAQDKPVDPKYGAKALLRSRHNNYLTLPILFIMISNHYPSTYGGTWNWAILMALVVISASARHYFNIRHKPEKATWILPLAALALLSLAWVTQPAAYVSSSVKPSQAINTAQTINTAQAVNAAVAPSSVASADSIDHQQADLSAQAFDIIQTRCASCHSAQPSSAMFSAPPAGVVFDSQQQVDTQKSRIYQRSVVLKTMPLANMTQMTEAERSLIGDWFHTLP